MFKEIKYIQDAAKRNSSEICANILNIQKLYALSCIKHVMNWPCMVIITALQKHVQNVLTRIYMHQTYIQ